MSRPPSIRKNFVLSGRKTARPALWGKDTLTIDRMSQDGRGVASRQGKRVFVSGALSGERVQVQCTAVKRDYDEARIIALADGSAASADRSLPECSIYANCGGCSLQHWSAQAQRRHKEASLLAMLREISPDLDLAPALYGPDTGFRHRLRLRVSRDPERRVVLGLRQRRSHQTVAVPYCLVANRAVNQLLAELPDTLSTIKSLQGLREIEVDADSDDRCGLCLYFSADPGASALSALRDALLTDPVIALRIRLAAARGSRDRETGPELDAEGAPALRELLTEGELLLRLPSAATGSPGGDESLQLAYQPGDFTQTNWEVNTQLVRRAIDWLQPLRGETALDLFSGIGNFSLPLARCAGRVHALEGDRQMTERLGNNARRNNIDNVRAGTADLLAVGLALPAADIAVLDPPRAGAKAVCEALARHPLQRLVYVSCHPATLLRDARILQRAGFTLTRAAAVDMFPHTGHSEAMALFRRDKTPD